MDRRDELRDFLSTRRARITPEQAGLHASGNRRVPGLRREEVAVLAGISVEYYVRLERGNAKGASDDVVDAVARALQLDDAERAHLDHLVRALQGASGGVERRPTPARVRPTVHRTGAKTLHDPVVGDLTLSYEALDLSDDDGQRILAYAAEPGSPSHERLRLLASWASPAAEPAHEHITAQTDDT